MPEDLKPRLDEFTAKVVNDPAKPQGTLLLQGFLGASSLPDHTRVYSDLTLKSYVDVANADIIHIEPMPKEQSPMGGSYLWVKQDADVLPGTPTGPGTAKAKFLEGPIAAEGAGAPKPGPSPHITVPIVACHPTIVLPACAVGTAAACQIPNPTINEVTPQVQQAGQAAAQFGIEARPHTSGPECRTQEVSVCILCPTKDKPCPTVVGPHCPTVACQQAAVAPTVSFCSVFCAPSQIAIHCVPHTPNCPQVVAHQTAVITCQRTFEQSVCVCPTRGCTQVGPECPVHTPQCPQVAHGAAAARVGAPQAQAAPAVSAAVAVCHTQLCPTFHRCPSVAGFDCPSVNRFHCPSVANFDCPTVNEFHCPSVNGFECWPTPNIQHCPTPNQICPQTPACPSFDICQTAGPNLC